MKQALTASGLLSVWFESAKSALAELGIEFEENRGIPSITGSHPEFGKIGIEFFIPVQGKTRMEITVDNPELIAQFKTQVIPAYKYISDLVIRQTKAEMAEEEICDDARTEQIDRSQAQGENSEVENTVPESDAEVTAQVFADKDNDLFRDEAGQGGKLEDHFADLEINGRKKAEKSQKKVKFCKNCGSGLADGVKVCPKCGKKTTGGGIIALIIIGSIVLLGAVGLAVFYFVGGSGASQSSTSTSQSASSSTQSTASGQTQQQDNASSSSGSITTNPTVILVTAEQYSQIQMGMTYEQVCAIMGREGTFLEPEMQIENESGGVSTLRTYYWEAQGTDGANVCITFQDGAVVTTSQFGLQ